MNFTGVTIWHKKGQEYKRLYFDTSTVTEEKAIEGSAAGELSKNSALIRIYALYECGISVGDKLCVGYDEAAEPPEGAYIITEIKGFFNVAATLRHYRIKCR